jgi:phenylacetic acid degradation operon negative regulatory protein
MTTSAVQQLLDNITRDNTLKTWSLIITFFGDAVVPRGGIIASSSLQAVMTELGFDNGAVRTALSRLSGDKQLTRERQGRNSYYALAPSQLDAFANAEKQIYAAPINQDKVIACRLTATDPETRVDDIAKESSAAISLGNGLALSFASNDAEPTKGKSVIEGVCLSLPNSLLNSVIPKALLTKYDRFEQDFAPIKNASALNGVGAVAARCLLIHEWRRLRLKTPAIPYQLLDEDSKLRTTHDQVAVLYQTLLEASDEWLAREAENRGGPLGPPQLQYRKRFGIKT